NGRFIEICYGGHGMARHLLHMGVLKDYIITFIHQNQVPTYNRHNKGKSPIYFRLLAKECLKHNKLKWAENLVNTSLQMLPNDKYAVEVKVSILRRKELYDEARSVLATAVKENPKELKHRLILIDLLYDCGKQESAKKEFYRTFEAFGSKEELKKREKKIQDIVE